MQICDRITVPRSYYISTVMRDLGHNVFARTVFVIRNVQGYTYRIGDAYDRG